MRVSRLELTGFRNYDSVSLSFGPGMNVLVGANGQGKTNLLEAVYALSTTKGLRTSRDSEMIRLGDPEARIAATVDRCSGIDTEVALTVSSAEKKAVTINGCRRPRMIELLGTVNCVFFGALDMRIVTGEPSVRRRYMDLGISQISPKYCIDLASQKKVLDQRNRLLRDIRDRRAAPSDLEAWTEQLIRYSAPVLAKRRAFVESLAPEAHKAQLDLSDGVEALEIAYAPNPPLGSAVTAQEIDGVLRYELEQVSDEEMRRGGTLVGPQRDDIRLKVNGAEARAYASQGQQRTVVLAMKMAEFALMEEECGEPPIMLLDDVMSDLDDQRRARLLRHVHGRCQTLLTCTNTRSFAPEVLDGAHVFRVESGGVSPVNDGS